jgi:hypothetical protein
VLHRSVDSRMHAGREENVVRLDDLLALVVVTGAGGVIRLSRFRRRLDSVHFHIDGLRAFRYFDVQIRDALVIDH